MENLHIHLLLQPWYLTGFFGWFAFFWVWFGIPTLLVIFVISYLRVFKRSRFRYVALLLPCTGLLFGLCGGYFAAWTDHRYYSMGMTESWWHIFALVGMPGNMMAESYGGDWQADEAWFYRSDITLWNGVFWTSVAVAGVFEFYFVTRQIDTPKSRTNA